MALYQSTVPYLKGALESLTQIITKGSAEGDFAKLLDARLTEDMLPLKFQIFFATDCVAKFAARSLGEEPIELTPFTEVTSLDQCLSNIEQAQEQLARLDPEALQARANADISFGFGPGRTAETDLTTYATGFTFPNVFFHTVTAYNILRKEGIQLGKMDYISPWGISKAKITEASKA
jgi:hypothetical protein